MNPHLYSLLALDIARERSKEAERSWLAASFAGTQPSPIARVRRHLAVLLAAVSRGSAWIVRRLDSRTADDLRRTLATAE